MTFIRSTNAVTCCFTCRSIASRLPEIKAFLAANNLQFAGFLSGNPATLQRFTTRFPHPSAPLDLDCWHGFETEEPNTFVGNVSIPGAQARGVTPTTRAR